MEFTFLELLKVAAVASEVLLVEKCLLVNMAPELRSKPRQKMLYNSLE